MARRLHFALLLLLLRVEVNAIGKERSVGLSRGDFPAGFVFGASTSAYQWEGAAAEDGRTPSVWDTFAHAGHLPGNGDVAADGYHKYGSFDMTVHLDWQNKLSLKDFDALQQRYILSEEITIVLNLPDGRGEVNPKGLEYYNNLINELLNHAYAGVCFKEFGDRVTNWTTLNEPNALTLLGYDAGIGPPGRCSEPFGNCSKGNSAYEPYIVAHHFLLAHSSAVSLYRRKYQDDPQAALTPSNKRDFNADISVKLTCKFRKVIWLVANSVDRNGSNTKGYFVWSLMDLQVSEEIPKTLCTLVRRFSEGEKRRNACEIFLFFASNHLY
ncbi:hypothetical protein PR202_gb26841 [Eleusine coracana subsp. coracana]|uniref:Beta-glucosidase n=1 Tax=Eleusine coracana subsp. coracana TaxID=191504 RepID=A0AAV5FSJ9_ELECO|nr:hypothetical protein PR202_gb26841 [Eleusine coracana subsp. coracana]